MNTVSLSLGPLQKEVLRRLAQWREDRVPERLWSKDPTLWSRTPLPELEDRLGWLNLPAAMRQQINRLQDFAEEVRSSGLRRVVVLGMGGSSLSAEVYQHSFGGTEDAMALEVLDTTHPDAVQAAMERIDPKETLFIVSSKSGTTLETISLFRVFWERTVAVVDEPGKHFVAITDPGTPLEELAREHDFREIFGGPPDVGGRFSALSVFGLVPAALIGASLGRLLGSAQALAISCAERESNPGLELGAALGELVLAGRDKLCIATSPSLATFPAWLEQLIAESLGKNGHGLIPVTGVPVGTFEVYDDDRAFVHLWVMGEEDPETVERLATLEQIGYPIIRVPLEDPYAIGREMFRWEVGVATAALVLGVHPFNQPDVQLAKELARSAMAGETEGEDSPESSAEIAPIQLIDWLQDGLTGDYVGIQAFLPPSPELTSKLKELQQAIGDCTAFATTLEYGPRFLHSTGQLHKGGPDTGLFLQLIDTPTAKVPVPGTDYDLGRLITAQADGDLRALQQRERRVLRLRVGKNWEALLQELIDVLD